MRRVIAILSVSVLIWGAGALSRLRHYDFRPSALVGFGCHPAGPCFARANRALLPAQAVVYRDGGYDGQFYYYIGAALGRLLRWKWAPAGGEPPPQFPPLLDAAPFRLARIGLPVLVLPWSLVGPEALLWGMLGTMLILHLLAVALVGRRQERRGDPPWTVWLFALNPFSLYSFLLVTADGTALALATIGLCLPSRRRTAAAVLFMAAARCPETRLVIPAASGAAALGTAARPRGGTGRAPEFRRAAWQLLVLPPVAGWWWLVGFSPLQAAERGSPPFVGLGRYLSQAPDALFSPRSILVLILIVWALAILAAVLALRTAPQSEGPTRHLRLTTCLLFLGLTGPAMAAHPEYWGTYANVMRLFTPLVAVFLFFPGPAAGHPSQFLRRALFLAGILLFTLSGLQIQRAWRSRALPVRVESGAGAGQGTPQ